MKLWEAIKAIYEGKTVSHKLLDPTIYKFNNIVGIVAIYARNENYKDGWTLIEDTPHDISDDWTYDYY